MKFNIIKIMTQILNVSILLGSIRSAFATDSSLISREGREILNNVDDRKKVEEAVERLKKGEGSGKVVLSNGKKITVRID